MSSDWLVQRVLDIVASAWGCGLEESCSTRTCGAVQRHVLHVYRAGARAISGRPVRYIGPPITNQVTAPGGRPLAAWRPPDVPGHFGAPAVGPDVADIWRLVGVRGTLDPPRNLSLRSDLKEATTQTEEYCSRSSLSSPRRVETELV